MATITTSRRRQRRYSVARDQIACVEFEHPQPNGEQFRMPLVTVSSSGVSFVVAEPPPGLDIGASLGKATIRVGECIMTGDLVVMHLTPDDSGALVCGALFYPVSDTDLVKLKSVVAGMEAVGTD